ncbi:MAG: phenylalanine--tRNA ligase subunit alpha [Acidimicrobiales bacterium]
MGEQSSPEEVLARVRSLEASFASTIVADLAALESMEHELLDKGGALSQLSRELSRFAPDDKRLVGEAINALRTRIRESLGELRQTFAAQARVEAERAEALDLTRYLVDASDAEIGSWHPVTTTREVLEDVFLGMGFSIAEGPEVETAWHNFEALNMPEHHPARDAQDSFFLRYGAPGSTVLRTHTSPVQIRLMQGQSLPIYAVAPGRVFRRDTADARHTPAFHQIEGLVVDEGITFEHLAGTVETFTKAYFGPSIVSRLRPAFFPFTEPSAEFEVTCSICLGEGCRTCSQTGWIELGGCGMVHPEVFRAVGVDPDRYSGFAFGFGIDRLAQMRYSIADMRVFLDNDVRFLKQYRSES